MKLSKIQKSVQKLSPIVAKLRVIKSDAEVSVMKRACGISSVAINRAMATVGSDDPINSENTLARYLEYQFVKGGCEKNAYIPVVASGSNALCLHYTRNDDLIKKMTLFSLMLVGNQADIVLIFLEHGQIQQTALLMLKEIYMKSS